MRFFSLILLVLFLSIPVLAQPGNNYIGVSHCLLCHSGETQGMIVEKWKAGPHARAFLSLGTEKAKQILKENYALVGNPLDHSFCLDCHATKIDPESTTSTYQNKEEGVSCEGCHGPGKAYSTSNIMSNHDLAVKNGLIADPKSACKKCHNENGHTPVWYNYEENWSKINHARIKVDTNQGQKQPGTAVDGKQVPTTIEMMKTQELDLPVAKPLQTKIDKPGVKRGKK